MQFVVRGDDFNQTFGDAAEVHEKELGRDYKLTVGSRNPNFSSTWTTAKPSEKPEAMLELYWGDELSVLADVSVSSRALDDPRPPENGRADSHSAGMTICPSLPM